VRFGAGKEWIDNYSGTAPTERKKPLAAEPKGFAEQRQRLQAHHQVAPLWRLTLVPSVAGRIQQQQGVRMCMAFADEGTWEIFA